MEALKQTFYSLPESEKVKFITELLQNSSRQTSQNSNETFVSESPEKSTSDCGQKRVYENSSSPEIFKSGESRKKQRTLDSWLIKHNTNKNNLNESPCQTKPQDNSSNIRTDSESCSYSSDNRNIENANCISPLNIIPNKNKLSDDINHINNESGETKYSADKDVCDHRNVGKNDVVAEKYNLRRSKRKIKTSTTDCCGTSVKCAEKVTSNIVNVSDNSKDLISQNRTLKKEKKKLKSNGELSPLKTTETSVSEECSDKTQILQSNASSNVQHINKTELSRNNLDTSTNNKTANKQRKKRKKSFNKSDTKCSNDCVAHEDLNGHLDVVTSKSNEHVIIKTSSQNHNYDAFTKLSIECNRIGLNIIDILEDKKIKNLLNDNKKLADSSVLFIGSCKSNTGKVLPVVHYIESKTRLLEGINLLEEKIQQQNSL